MSSAPAWRRAVDAFARAALAPPTLGALYVLALLPLGSRGAARGLSPGFDDAKARAAITVAATAIALGASLGAVAGALVAGRDRLAPRPDRSAWRRRGESLAVTIALHAWFVAWAVADAPALHEAAGYARGGLPRTLQILASDALGARAVVGLGAAAVAAYVAGSPERLRSAWSRLRSTLPRVARPLALVALVLVALAAARSRLPRASPVAKASDDLRPNFLVFAVDGLRDDRLTSRTTPHLAALADRATRFEHAYVADVRPAAAWAALLRGRAPLHGLEVDARDALPARLGAAGYTTSLVTDATDGGGAALDLGFGAIVAPRLDEDARVRRRALLAHATALPVLQTRLGARAFPLLGTVRGAFGPDRLADDVIDRLGSLGRAPFFMTVFFSSAEPPFAVPAIDRERFTDPAYRGRFKYGVPEDLADRAPPDADDLAQLGGLYDGAVRAIDAAASRILDALARRDPSRSTMIIVTAPRSAALLGAADPPLLGDAEHHVPLLVFDPRRPSPRRASELVRDVDLAATVYALTGVAPPVDLEGRSLAPALAGAALDAACAFAESAPGPSLSPSDEDPDVAGSPGGLAAWDVARIRAVRDARWTLVYTPTRQGAVYTLFDALDGPPPMRDVAPAHPAEVARLRGALWAWMLRDRRMTERGGVLVPSDPARCAVER